MKKSIFLAALMPFALFAELTVTTNKLGSLRASQYVVTGISGNSGVTDVTTNGTSAVDGSVAKIVFPSEVDPFVASWARVGQPMPGGVTTQGATNIANNRIDAKVADWALKPNPAPVTDLTPALVYTTAVSNKLEAAKQNKLADYTTTNAVISLISEHAPAPGDYAAVSNRAMHAVTNVIVDGASVVVGGVASVVVSNKQDVLFIDNPSTWNHIAKVEGSSGWFEPNFVLQDIGTPYFDSSVSKWKCYVKCTCSYPTPGGGTDTKTPTDGEIFMQCKTSGGTWSDIGDGTETNLYRQLYGNGDYEQRYVRLYCDLATGSRQNISSEIDSLPSSSSTNKLVTSKGVADALASKITNPSDGSAGQVLTKTTNDIVWADAASPITAGNGLSLSTNGVMGIVQSSSAFSMTNLSVRGSSVIVTATGAASGFTADSYIVIDKEFSPGSSPWSIETKVLMPPAYSSSRMTIVGSERYNYDPIMFGTLERKMEIDLSSGTSSQITEGRSTWEFNFGSTYFFKMAFDGTRYYLAYKPEDGLQYVEVWSYASSTPVFGGDKLAFGVQCTMSQYHRVNPFLGTIYLADTKVMIGDEVFYYGGGTGGGGDVAKATDSLYGLVKPDNSTITINDGVIAASGVIAKKGTTNSVDTLLAAARTDSETISYAAISHTNAHFSNEVLAVGLNVPSNTIAAINYMATNDTLVAAIGEFAQNPPIDPTTGATTVGGLLAALAAAVAWLKKNKADASVIGDINTALDTINGEVA